MADGVGRGSGKRSKVEDLYRLSAVQEALLLHRRRVRGSDNGVVVLDATLEGELSQELFELAWRDTLAAHPELRRSIEWRDLPHPVQVVHRRVELAIEGEDLRDVDPEERAGRVAHRVARWRNDGLDLRRPPVMEVWLGRISAREHRLLWATHHLLLDGWSSALVLDEVLARCAGAATSEASGADRFRDYVAWSRGPEAPPAAAFGKLFDWRPSPLLTGLRWRGEVGEHRRVEHLTAPELARRLEAAARRRRVTTDTLVTAAWALTVAEATGSSRPAFAFVSSGRGVDLPDMETRLGNFANALPLQLAAASDTPLPDWLETVFGAREAVRVFEARPLADLLEATGVAAKRPLVDSLLAHANFPAAAGAESGPRVTRLESDVTSAFPLTVAVATATSPRLTAYFDPALFAESAVEALLERCGALLEALATDSADPTLGALLEAAPGNLAADGLWAAGSTGRSIEAPPPRTGPEPSVEDGGAASTPTEAQLARIWNDLIEVREFGVEDSFFDLGGHSMLVPALIQRVRQDFGVDLPLGAIFATPTVRGLAAVIEDGGGQSDWPSLVTVRLGSGGNPLYLVHGLGGEVGWFYNLAPYLGRELPLFGLQAPAEPYDDLPAMAAHYVAEIERHQPHGPYRLGGYCVGGGVAFEMARQLRTRGETVERLFLIDSVPQSHAVAEQNRPSGWMHRARRLAAKEPREMAASVRDLGQRAARRLTRAFDGGAPVELDDVLDMRTLPAVYRRASRRHFRAMRDYEPGSYDGDVWLFRTHDERFGEDFGWRALVEGRLEIVRIEGGHLEVLDEPHVAGLGAQLAVALEEADRP